MGQRYWRILNLLCAFLILPVLVGCGGVEGRRILSIEEFSGYSSLPATIEGTPREAYIARDSCLYAEWAAGPFQPDGTGELEPIFQSTDSIVIVTPHGAFPIDIFSLRLYLRSTLSRTFGPENAGMAPLPVQNAVKEIGGTISVHEFIIRPGQTYWARVAIDSMIVSRGSSEAGETVPITRRIIEVSDRPFDEARQSPVTPATR